MGLVLLGVLLVVMKLLEAGPPADWSWWAVLSPFAGAVVWWTWADKSGYTQRRAMAAMERKKAERRQAALNALGITEDKKRRKKVPPDRDAAALMRRASKIKKARAAREQQARDSILASRFDESSKDS